MAAAAETTVGVNFVSNVKQALASISSLEGAVSRLGAAGKALGIIGAGILIGAQIKGAISTILSSGIQAENQLTMLTTSLQDATKAFELYQQTVQFASTTPFEANQVIDSVVRLQAIGVQAYSTIGRTSTDVMTAIGNMAGAMGKSMEESSMAVIQGLTGEMERLKQFGIVVGNLPPRLRGLTRGSQEWKEGLLEYIATLPRFQGGMDRMSQTMTGIISNIKDGVSLFVTSIADVREVTGFYSKVKEFLGGIATWVADNTQAIMLYGRIIGQVLGHIFDIIVVLLSPLWAVVRMVASVFETMQKKINALAGQTETHVATFQEKIRAMGILFERIKLYISLLFELIKMKLEEWYAAFGKVMDFFGVDAKTVLMALGILIGVWLVYHVVTFIRTLGKLLFTMKNLQRAGIFMLALAIAKLIQDWDQLSDAAKAARIVLIALGAVLYLMATNQMVSLIKSLKALAKGFMSIGIMALIAAIVLLVVYWDEVSAAVKDAWASFSTFLDGLGSWGTQIKQGLESVFGGVVTYFQGLWDIIAGLFTLDWERMKGGFDKVIKGFLQFWDGIFDIAGGVVEGIFTALGFEDLGKKLNSALQSIWSGIKNSFGGIADVVIGIFTLDGDRILQGLESIWQGFKDFLSAGLDIMDGVGGAIVDSLFGEGTWSSVKQGAADAWDWVTNAASTSAAAVSTAWQSTKDFFGGVVNNISSWWANTTNNISEQWDQANSVVKSGMGNLQGFWQDTSTAIKDWWYSDTATMGDLWSSVSSSMQTRWNDFYAAFSATDFGAWLTEKVNWMKEIWNNFTTWLSGLWTQLWERITGALSSAVDSVKEWFGSLFGEDDQKRARRNAERLGRQVSTDLSNMRPTVTLRANTNSLVSDINRAASRAQINPAGPGLNTNPLGGYNLFGVPAFASGGRLNPGELGIVGEQGPEFAVGGRQGTTIFPNDILNSLVPKQTTRIANNVNLTISVDARGSEQPRRIAEETAAKLRETLPEVLRGLSFG